MQNRKSLNYNEKQARLVSLLAQFPNPISREFLALALDSMDETTESKFDRNLYHETNRYFIFIDF
jgi:hypothetical protein